MVLRSNDIVLKMKYPDEFLRTLKDSGVLNIDSATFYELRKDIVTPQPLIDSIFKGNVDTLLSHFLMIMVLLPLNYHMMKKNT